MKTQKTAVKNAADGRQVKVAKKNDKLVRNQELKDLKAVMSTPEGRRVMFRIVNDIAHIDTLSAVNSGSLTYLNEGERNVGRILKADIWHAAFDEWQEMEREHVASILEEVDLDK